MSRLILTSVVVLLLLGVSGVQSQERVLEPRPRGIQQPAAQRTDFQTKLMVARQLIQSRSYANAAALLESLLEQDKDNDIVDNLLQMCYSQLKLYPKVEIMIRQRLEKFPGNISYQIRLAELLALQGRTQEAIEEYDKAIAGLSGRDEPRYLMVIRSLIAHELEPKALQLIDSARITFSDADVFRIERAAILVNQRAFSEAGREYLLLLSEDTTHSAMEAEKKVLELLRFEETATTIEPILLAEAEVSKSSRLLRLIASHYLSSGRFNDAFDFAIKTDSVAADNGQFLLSYLRQCRDHRAFEPMVRMSEYVQSRYPDAYFITELRFDYASALSELGHSSGAISVYQRIIDESSEKGVIARALLSIGLIHRDVNFDYEAALLFLDSTVRTYPAGVTFLDARRAIPEVYIRLGQLSQARIGLAQLSQMNLNEDLSEEAAYKLAMIDFYEKKFSESEPGLRKLMVDYPRGFYVNDALQTLLIISRAEGDTLALYDYSNARLFQARLLGDSAEVYLKRISEAGSPTLADVAYYLLADLGFDRNDTVSALDQISRLLERFPDSYYVQFGMKMKADVLAEDEATAPQAAALYAEILEKFPNCPFASDVRLRLRGLRLEEAIG